MPRSKARPGQAIEARPPRDPNKTPSTDPTCVMLVTTDPSSDPSDPGPPSRGYRQAIYCCARFSLLCCRGFVFGLSMICLTGGITLCIWGYTGEQIKALHVLGPVLLVVGFFLSVGNCLMSCREEPPFERTVRRLHQEEKVREAVALLGQPEVVAWLQCHPRELKEFHDTARIVLDAEESET